MFPQSRLVWLVLLVAGIGTLIWSDKGPAEGGSRSQPGPELWLVPSITLCCPQAEGFLTVHQHCCSGDHPTQMERSCPLTGVLDLLCPQIG